MTLLAIDPGRSYKGERTIGYALFDPEELERGVMNWEELIVRFDVDGPDLWFRDSKGHLVLIHKVVVEDFVNDPGRSARGGQRNGTSECIGGIEMACGLTRTPMYRQPNTLLPVAKRHADYTDTHKHLPHQDAAYLHGFEHLVREGVLQPKGLSGTL